LALQDRVAITHLQVQMRVGRIAAVSEQRKHISSMNMIVQPRFDASNNSLLFIMSFSLSGHLPMSHCKTWSFGD
jgi:hypothetical protein